MEINMEIDLALAPRHRKVMSVLASRAPSRLTVKEIHGIVGGSITLLYSDLAVLAKYHHVTRHKIGRRNNILYSVGGGTEYEDLPNVDSATMLSWLQRFAESTEYLTKVQEFGWMFPNMLARVYQLACRGATGEAVTKYELDLIKTDFAKFVKTCDMYVTVIKALLVQDELWDPNQLQPYLCGDAPVEIVQSFTEKLLDNWGEPR